MTAKEPIHESSIYQLRKYITGMILLTFVITAIAGVMTGARVITILYRGVSVFLILWLIGCILRRYWVTIVSNSLSRTKRSRQIKR